MHSDLGNHVALVTGGAGAIGQAIARRLAESGALVVVADIDPVGASRVAAPLPGAMACALDITNGASVEAAVAAILSRHGRLDILVNNAGVNSFADRVTLEAVAVEEWDRVTGVDLDGLFLMSRAALAPMLARGEGGRVVNIASVVGLLAMRLQAPFVAAKAGVVHLTRAMALEFGGRGILANAVAPGSVLTDGTRGLFYAPDGSFAGRAEEFMRHVPLGRPAVPEEIAEAVLFLASPASAYVNGQVLAVDGGWTAGYMI